MEFHMEKENASTEMDHLTKGIGKITSHMEMDLRSMKMAHHLEGHSKTG